jgi:hypothetical protein
LADPAERSLRIAILVGGSSGAGRILHSDASHDGGFKLKLKLEAMPLLPIPLKDRVLGRTRPENALIELRNTIVQGVASPLTPAALAEKYGFDVRVADPGGCRRLLSEVVSALISDGELSDAELEYLKRVISVLGLTATGAQAEYVSAASRVLAEHIARASLKQTGQSEDLDLIRRRLRLSRQDAECAVKLVLNDQADELVSELVADDCLSNEDVSRLNAFLAASGLKASDLSPETQAKLEESRARRDLLVAPLQPVEDPTIALQKGEVGYGIGIANWYDDVDDPSADGVSGDFVVTNKRLIVAGLDDRAKSITWNSVVRSRGDRKGNVVLVKSRGKSPFVEVVEMHAPAVPRALPLLVTRMLRRNL